MKTSILIYEDNDLLRESVSNMIRTSDRFTLASAFENALKVYPNLTKRTLLPVRSESFPKYPLLNPAVASATPSKIPMRTIENPID